MIKTLAVNLGFLGEQRLNILDKQVGCISEVVLVMIQALATDPYDDLMDDRKAISEVVYVLSAEF